MDTNEWIMDDHQIKPFDDGDEIMTLFTNIIGDRITIYISKINDNKIQLSDDGNTLNDLVLLGIDIKNNEKSKIIKDILYSSKVQLNNNQILKIDGQKEDFKIMGQDLIQTILKFDDSLTTENNQY